MDWLNTNYPLMTRIILCNLQKYLLLLNQKFWNVDLLFDSNQRNLRSFTRKFKFLIIKLNLRTDFSYTLHKELSIFLMKTFCIFWFIQKIFDLKKISTHESKINQIWYLKTEKSRLSPINILRFKFPADHPLRSWRR